MRYIDFLKTVKKCPFCFINKKLIIKDGKQVFLKYANAPYIKNHLLVIPKRDVVSFLKLTSEERKEIEQMLKFGVKILHKNGHLNVSILVRDGTDVGKSVPHLHYHIIPDMPIGPPELVSKKREVLTEEEEMTVVKKFKKKNRTSVRF